jgi:RHH-type proline utilization regulon transcriptional repressor/proline dehydrogenase/delta 1-pyrroline-5-carboxylate dehydrogenase
VENDVQALERRLLDAARRGEPLTLTPAWWQDRLLEWATSDPDFRVTLLRFVDVLPALRTAASVADHIRQYFRGGGPALAQVGSGLAAAPLFRPIVSRVARGGVYGMAGRFIAGETAQEALARLQELADAGIGYTVDLLGEATLSEAEADAYLGRYRELIETLAARTRPPAGDVWAGVPPVNISLKLSALCSQMEPAAPRRVSSVIRERLRPLLRLAREKGAFLNVDMEQYRLRDLIHTAFADALQEREFRDFAGAGIVVQAYLRDAREDLRRLRRLAEERGTPITVRLVKGAYWDEERIVASQNEWPAPVFEDKAATDASFEACTDDLLDAWPHLRPAFASHNPRSVAQAMVKARARGLDDDEIEFQTLHGMAEGLREGIAALGYRTRVYVPIGPVIPGMAYLVRRLLESTTNQGWFLSEQGEVSPEEALAPPRPGATPRPLPARAFRNAAPATFFAPETRRRMQEALRQVEGEFGRRYSLLVAGGVKGRRERDQVRYPASPSRVVGHVQRATGADVEAAVAAAREAQPAWRDLPAWERADRLRRAASAIGERRFELAATMVFESAKPWHEADGDVTEAIDYLNYYALQAERLGPRRLGETLGEENEYRLEGRGVTAVIAPWNFPLAIICGMSAGALAAGSCAILKPAGQSPVIAYKLAEILREAGVPAGAVQLLPGPGGAIGRALVEHAGVDNIAFTGSKEVGLEILRAAAETRPGQRGVKRVVAEMGGKNAVIIDDDADLDQAVAGTVVSAFGYAGQKCSACSRLIVVGGAYDEAVERLGRAVESLVVGPPHEPETFVPPLISAAARDRVQGYVDGAMKTARLLARGRAPSGEGYYLAPAVFDQVDPADRLAREEVFGPVLAIFRAHNFEEALALAMDSEYALTGGVFSRNPRHVEMARRAFRVGNLYINRKTTGAVVGRQPFGGLALSGVGQKAGGPEYILQFMEPRVITENTARRGFAPESPAGE